jgi:hypothetical protein
MGMCRLLALRQWNHCQRTNPGPNARTPRALASMQGHDSLSSNHSRHSQRLVRSGQSQRFRRNELISRVRCRPILGPRQALP